jgi:hypothetical protein
MLKIQVECKHSFGEQLYPFFPAHNIKLTAKGSAPFERIYALQTK